MKFSIFLFFFILKFEDFCELKYNKRFFLFNYFLLELLLLLFFYFYIDISSRVAKELPHLSKGLKLPVFLSKIDLKGYLKGILKGFLKVIF